MVIPIGGSPHAKGQNDTLRKGTLGEICLTLGVRIRVVWGISIYEENLDIFIMVSALFKQSRVNMTMSALLA